MFDTPLQYWKEVCARAVKETFAWSGTAVFGLVATIGIYALQRCTSVDVKNSGWLRVLWPYGLVIIGIYVWQMMRCVWIVQTNANLCGEHIWVLKVKVREIKRRWPNSSFVKRLTDRKSWSPEIGRPETGIGGTELEKAIEWHDEFTRVCGFTQGKWPSFDWDDTMQFLDRRDRLLRGLKE